jgi:protein-disulfide isomerase
MPLRRTALCLLLAGALAAAGCGGDESGSPTSPTTPAAPLTNVAELLGERSLGSESAPVTIVQYSSLTCPHCATFHQITWPLIKSTYVETGQVRLVYRDFPLDSTAVAGASLARCAGAARFFDALDILYGRQSTWSSAADPRAAMKQALAPLGVPADQMNACLASTELQNGILQIRQDGQTKDGVTAVPTFFVNGRKLVGALPYTSFDEAIKSVLGNRTEN